MYSSRVCGGKAFSVDQKIRELKKVLFKTRSLDERLGKRIRPNKLIGLATSNLNKIKSPKFRFAPELIESKSIESDQFREKYNFHTLQKVKQKTQIGDQNKTIKRYKAKKKNKRPFKYWRISLCCC